MGNVSTDTAKGVPMEWELACVCWLPPSAAELLGGPQVASFQPGSHHPIPEALLWPCAISLYHDKEHRCVSGTLLSLLLPGHIAATLGSILLP